MGRGATYAAFGGSSYGAIATLYHGDVDPGMFGRLLLESPSLYVGRRRAAADMARRVQPLAARIYLGVGTAETRRDDWNDETVANVRGLEPFCARQDWDHGGCA